MAYSGTLGWVVDSCDSDGSISQKLDAVIISSCTPLSTKYAHMIQGRSGHLFCGASLSQHLEKGLSKVNLCLTLGRVTDVFHNVLLHIITNKSRFFKIHHLPPEKYQEPSTQMSTWMTHDFCCVGPYRHPFERASCYRTPETINNLL